MSSLQKDPSASAIVPIENSIEGTINVIADSLIEQNFVIIEEIFLDIAFALYGLPNQSFKDIQRVYSISPAISQTQKFIHEQQFDYDYTTSTVASLEKLMPQLVRLPLSEVEKCMDMRHSRHTSRIILII